MNGDQPNLHGHVFLTPDRIIRLQERVAERREPTWSAWQQVREEADKARERAPQVPEVWHVPGFYDDADGHRNSKRVLQDDANATYTLALAYQITGDDAYADAALRFINAWSRLEKLRTADDSTLSFSYHFPAIIFGAALLSEYEAWTPDDREQFAAFLKERALPMNTMQGTNNWGNWGLVLVLAIAAYLQDAGLFEEGVARWKDFIEHQIAEDGHLPHEVTRNRGLGGHGIWYSHFTLMPQTIAAEIARVNGVDLYDYESPSGRTLKLAFHRLAPWVRNPDSFPYYKGGDDYPLRASTYISYFEILHPRWPHPDARALIEQHRPLTATHSAPHITFTHGHEGEAE